MHKLIIKKDNIEINNIDYEDLQYGLNQAKIIYPDYTSIEIYELTTKTITEAMTNRQIIVVEATLIQTITPGAI